MNETDPWTDLATTGFVALGKMQPSEAAHAWLSARESLAPATPSDPRRATTLNNAGVAHLLLGAPELAKPEFTAAERLWEAVLGDIPALDVPVTGASSAFHFRLASTNLAAFAAARKRRYAKLSEACLAIARFNRLTAAICAGDEVPDIEWEQRTLSNRLSDTFGPGAPDLRLLALGPSNADTRAAAAAYADKASAWSVTGRTMASAASEACRHLETAIALIALAAPVSGRIAQSGRPHTDTATNCQKLETRAT